MNLIDFCYSINHSVLPKGRSFTANSAFSTVPSSQHSFSYLHTSWCWLPSYMFFCRELSSRLPFLIENPWAGSSFLTSGPANFFSSSVPALFFLLPLFLAQLHFLFCLSILRAPSFSISISQMFPVVFAHSVVVSKSLHHMTLQYTQSTSLASFLVLFTRVRRKSFLPVKIFFSHCYPLLYFLTAIQVATDITPKNFKLYTCSTDSSLIRMSSLLWFSSDNQSLRHIYIYLHPIILTCHLAPSTCSPESFHLLLAKPYQQISCTWFFFLLCLPSHVPETVY